VIRESLQLEQPATCPACSAKVTVEYLKEPPRPRDAGPQTFACPACGQDPEWPEFASFNISEIRIVQPEDQDAEF
jgi:endogenous inhibitor of DNA gyrase (YacG/DUF329 family)